tara:strand:- start:155 stop:1291 length:1137 start_codon:yes stop_codon:yes gene_type:complete
MPGYELIGRKEKKAVSKLFDEGGVLFAHGFEKQRKKFHVREFEESIKTFFKTKHALAVSSGTAAIKIALLSLGVKPGDEVITQAFNFIATIEAIRDVGAKPIICNIDETLNMDINDLRKRITKKTKVIIPVHMLGMSAKIVEICSVAKKNKIYVLEDNCESVGAKIDNRFLGTLGHVGILSLDFGKIITSGEGGVILSDSKRIEKFCREYHDHGHENNPAYTRGNDTRRMYGFNYRMTEIQAVIAKVQLSKLNFIIKENRKRFKILEKNLSNKVKQRYYISESSPIYDCFIFFVEQKSLRLKIIEILHDKKFGTKNIPDALKWHCAYYWDHALDKNEYLRSKKTMEILKQAIAIPMLLKKSLKDYKLLIRNINRVLNS